MFIFCPCQSFKAVYTPGFLIYLLTADLPEERHINKHVRNQTYHPAHVRQLHYPLRYSHWVHCFYLKIITQLKVFVLAAFSGTYTNFFMFFFFIQTFMIHEKNWIPPIFNSNCGTFEAGDTKTSSALCNIHQITSEFQQTDSHTHIYTFVRSETQFSFTSHRRIFLLSCLSIFLLVAVMKQQRSLSLVTISFFAAPSPPHTLTDCTLLQ